MYLNPTLALECQLRPSHPVEDARCRVTWVFNGLSLRAHPRCCFGNLYGHSGVNVEARHTVPVRSPTSCFLPWGKHMSACCDKKRWLRRRPRLCDFINRPGSQYNPPWTYTWQQMSYGVAGLRQEAATLKGYHTQAL